MKILGKEIKDPRETTVTIGGILTALSIVGLGGYALKLISLANHIDFKTDIKIHHIDFSHLTLNANVMVENPTNHTIEVKQPYIALYKDKQAMKSHQVLANTQPSSRTYQLQKEGSTPLENLLIHIPMTSALQLLLKEITTKGNKLELWVKIRTTVTLKWGLKKTIVLKRPITFDIPDKYVLDIQGFLNQKEENMEGIGHIYPLLSLN